jgi:hypothetical protein
MYVPTLPTIPRVTDSAVRAGSRTIAGSQVRRRASRAWRTGAGATAFPAGSIAMAVATPAGADRVRDRRDCPGTAARAMVRAGVRGDAGRDEWIVRRVRRSSSMASSVETAALGADHSSFSPWSAPRLHKRRAAFWGSGLVTQGIEESDGAGLCDGERNRRADDSLWKAPWASPSDRRWLSARWTRSPTPAGSVCRAQRAPGHLVRPAAL